MESKIRNIAASVHQRLLNQAKKSARPFNELLQYYAVERFLYRLSKSDIAGRFILKGALMIWVWRRLDSRPTKDIDLLGRIDNDLEVIKTSIKGICLMDVTADGMVFDPESVTTFRIKEDAEYEGVRARIKANLGNARISVQIDIGFGDEVVPAPSNIMYPGILDFPTPEIKGYTMESLIAEKFEAMVKLGMLNSRMKDFYDVWILSRSFNFDNAILAEAIRTTFKNRGTEIIESPKVFEPSFREDETKQIQWSAFIKKSKLVDAPQYFSDVIKAVKDFLLPIIV